MPAVARDGLESSTFRFSVGFGFSTTDEYTPDEMKRATLSDYVVTRNGDLVVVTIGVVQEEIVFNGITKLSAQKNPRMLTFLEDKKGEWKMNSGAVFSPPAEVPICVNFAASANE